MHPKHPSADRRVRHFSAFHPPGPPQKSPEGETRRGRKLSDADLPMMDYQ
jgi:hypothetical protein